MVEYSIKLKIQTKNSLISFVKILPLHKGDNGSKALESNKKGSRSLFYVNCQNFVSSVFQRGFRNLMQHKKFPKIKLFTRLT